jgi:hypothetical protein
MTLDFSLRPIIEAKIKEIEREYQQSQGLILTEDDLKCLLYGKLMEIPGLSEKRITLDPNISAHSIHAEVSWYDDNRKLTIKPDITILEPKNLSVLHGCYGYDAKLPSKQFEFYGKAIILELKFIRNKTGIKSATLEGPIRKDFKKIKRLFERLESQSMPDSVFCYFIIFNKTNTRCREFDYFIEQNRESNRHRIIYATGNVNYIKGKLHGANQRSSG